MTKRKDFSKQVLLVRSYRNDGSGAIGRVIMHMPSFDAAVKAFAVYTRPYMATDYCALFSPVDKRGVRRQLKRYVYSAMLPVSKAAQMRLGLRVIIDEKALAKRDSEHAIKHGY